MSEYVLLDSALEGPFERKAYFGFPWLAQKEDIHWYLLLLGHMARASCRDLFFKRRAFSLLILVVLSRTVYYSDRHVDVFRKARLPLPSSPPLPPVIISPSTGSSLPLFFWIFLPQSRPVRFPNLFSAFVRPAVFFRYHL